MNARSALFDVYGDHLRATGGVAPVASLVQLMAPLGITAPAVRTAISRMVRQGWLEPIRLEAVAAYRLTPKADRRLTDAAQRIYRSPAAPWDHRWHLLVIDKGADRASRERIRSGLSYFGYALLRDDTWISPHTSGEVDALVAAEGVRTRRFLAEHDGDDVSLTATLWDLDELGRSYLRWLADARLLIANTQIRGQLSDRDSFVMRSRLVHEWRKFLFSDPGLPPELLPADWPGDTAAQFFDEQATRLVGGARRYVEACLR
ncbi:MAG: PaaX family transcriptional regulator [Nocardioidaceae bacterium]|nr:PaaX family transcriptional regulator [Nocardioidaceae bacterium]